MHVRPARAANRNPASLSAQEAAWLARLPHRIHWLRTVGMALGAACIATVLHEHASPWWVWALCVFTGLGWPQLAYLIAVRSASPYRAEVRNLLTDSAIAAWWVPLMHFNLLPSALLLTLVTMDKISSGIPRLWIRSLPVMLIAILCAGVLTGFAFQPASSMKVIVACLPMLLIHTLAVSLASSRLVREVQYKKRQLDLLSRTDTLTGLDSRSHWTNQVSEALQKSRAGNTPAVLMMLDIDAFKGTNDAYGHAIGDEVLRSVSDAIQRSLNVGDHAGRLGGDEFGVVVSGADLQRAQQIAERIRSSVQASRIPSVPEAVQTVSIGMAPVDIEHLDAEQWIRAADAALYRAKRAGRNRVST